MDIYKKIEEIDDADKLVTHKRELQQCEIYMNMLTLPLVNDIQIHEGRNMPQIIKRANLHLKLGVSEEQIKDGVVEEAKEV